MDTKTIMNTLLFGAVLLISFVEINGHGGFFWKLLGSL